MSTEAARTWVLGHMENLLASIAADPAISDDNKAAAREISSELNSLVFFPTLGKGISTSQLADFYGVKTMSQLVSA